MRPSTPATARAHCGKLCPLARHPAHLREQVQLLAWCVAAAVLAGIAFGLGHGQQLPDRDAIGYRAGCEQVVVPP